MIGLNRENQIFNTIWGNFTSVWWGFYLEVVWLWRISGSYSQEMMGLV